MTWTNSMTENELLELQNLLSVSKEDAVLFAENKLQVKSKKKRIRNKVRKQIVTKLSNMKQSVHSADVTIKENPTEVDVSSLPVTFVLGLGKDYFADLNIVKSYYTKSKEAYYKNKELLTETINQAIQDEAPPVQHEIIKIIEEKQK